MLLFVAAFSIELQGLIGKCSEVREEALPVHFARRGLLGAKPVLAIANGMGQQRARAAVRSVNLPVRAVCSLGFCGALDPELQPGDIVVAARVNGERVAQPRTPAMFFSGDFTSTERVAATAEEKSRLHASGAIAVEMEGAAVAEFARERNVPCYAIRGVTDTADETLRLDFEAAVREDGNLSTGRLLGQAARDPFRRFAELIRLARRSSLAAKRLGEFVAGCQF